MCIACMSGRDRTQSKIKVNGKYPLIIVPLIQHHVRYDPELVAYVHFTCHQIIHNPEDDRYKHLIQYQEGDSKEYYDKKKL